MMTATRLLLIISAATAMASCNSFDPELGGSPFRCGANEPRCPEDYTCVQYSATDEICEANHGAPPPDGGSTQTQVDCTTDMVLEPNNATLTATQTNIPATADMYRLVGLALCPNTDTDMFEVGVDQGFATIIATIQHNSANGALTVDILNGTSTIIGDGEPLVGDPDTVVARVDNAPSGDYYVRVTSATGAENNYSIEIVAQ